MTSRSPKSSSTWLVDWELVTIPGNTLPPRDPNDDDDEDAEDEDSDGENQPNEPAIVREPDEE